MRNNTRVMIDSFDLAGALWELVRDHAPSPHEGDVAIGLNERFRIYRYDPGQQFDWHYDGYYRRQIGEQSKFTLMFYLNDGYEGGQTDFRDCSVIPQQGDALLFWHHIRHRGAPVTAGRKYALRTDVMYRFGQA